MTKDEILKVRNVVYERSVHCSGCYLVDQTAGKGAYIKCSCGITEALAILDAAISEPEQEPVAYLNDRYMTLHSWHPGIYRTAAMIAGELQPLYRKPPAPQSAQPVGEQYEWQRIKEGCTFWADEALHFNAYEFKRTGKTRPIYAISADISHADDLAVDRFAAAMKAKMAKQRARGYAGWDDPASCPAERLQSLLVDHLPKGDPVDVGNFAMMLFCRGEHTAPPSREWVELTEADKRNLTHQTLQVFQAALRADGTGRADPMTLINFTEQLLRAKNSGEQA